MNSKKKVKLEFFVATAEGGEVDISNVKQTMPNLTPNEAIVSIRTLNSIQEGIWNALLTKKQGEKDAITPKDKV